MTQDASGRKPTKAELAAIKTKAIRELDRYSADPTLRAKWNLNGGKTADLKPEGRLKAAEGGDLSGNRAADLQAVTNDLGGIYGFDADGDAAACHSPVDADEDPQMFFKCKIVIDD